MRLDTDCVNAATAALTATAMAMAAFDQMNSNINSLQFGVYFFLYLL